MNHKRISDKLVLVYNRNNGKPLGTGFIVNEFGHFITCYHVLRNCDSIKDSICCWWKGHDYRVRYIQQLAERGFYKALRHGDFPLDLTILRLPITNENFRAEHLPALTFDMNEDLSKPVELSFSGFNCEKCENKEDAKLSAVTATLTKYQKENGLWLFGGDNAISQGHSGSPVLHPELGEVMGVVVRRSAEDSNSGAVQSLHMLSDKLRSYGYDCERFFRSPYSLYGAYHRSKCRSFEKDDWPYAIDKKEFVDAFDFETGRFPLKGSRGKAETKGCIPFIVDRLHECPVFCVGYYGMGKTTISKFLFAKHSLYSQREYPVYVSLGGKRLRNLNSDNWASLVARKMCEDFKRSGDGTDAAVVDDESTRQYFRHFLNNNRVTLILDGIDEALCDRTSLGEFAEVLKSLPCTYFLTSRREFYAFFDEFELRMAKQPHLVVELMPWQKKQWGIYIGNLYKNYPEKSESINGLEKALSTSEYGELPERPLFLKMISDLELDNHTELEGIPPELKSNRAAVYYAYVRWKILDDYERKKGLRDKTLFRKESFELFRELAEVEYERSVPKGGARESIGRDLHDSGSYTYSGFSMADIKTACADRVLLDYDFVREHFFESTFFSMIRRDVIEESGEDVDEIYRFSHKSFCEYLTAYNLAQSVFGGAVEQAECGRAWGFYQTHEVSTHFEDEVKRICHVRNLEEGTKKEFLRNAFENVLLVQSDLENYSEICEEVLYYTGRFRIDSPKILSVLERIAKDPSGVDPTYYRTAHLSLGMCRSPDYCEKYVEYLIDSFHRDRDAFSLNADIQNNYYGKGNMHSVLKKVIDTFIEGGNFEGILPLKIFSYFACLPFDATEINSAREYLERIRSVCIERGHVRMKKIMDATLPIVEGAGETR